MEQSPSWQANRFSASQEIPHILWNTKVHYHIHKTPPPVPIQNQINSVHVLHPTSWRLILTLSSHLRLRLPSGPFPSGFPTKPLYAPLLFPIRATCPAHLIKLDLIPWAIFDELISLSSSLYSFLHFRFNKSLLGPNILLSTLFSNILSPCSSLSVSHQVLHP